MWTTLVQPKYKCKILLHKKLDLHNIKKDGRLTLLLYEHSEQRVGTWNSFTEIVIIVNWKKVTMDIGIAKHNIYIGDIVDLKEKIVEVLKRPRLISI